MNSVPESFRKWTEDAAAIKSSGRWSAVNERIEALCASPGTDNAWWVQLMASLCYKNFSEYRGLKSAHENRQDDDISLLAWRARNLLELSVWANYCANGRENARRLYEDAGRDANELYEGHKKWGEENGLSVDHIVTAQSELAERATLENVNDLDSPYKRVQDAAKEVSSKESFESFKSHYKLLSKFAHPTAMQILSPPNSNQETLQRDFIYGLGCLFFACAFSALEGQLRGTSEAPA